MASDLALRPADPAPLSLELAPVVERARAYAKAARAETTLRTYAGEWKQFCAWCTANGAEPLPAAGEIVALYLAHLADAGRKASGIEVALVAISNAHRLAGHPSPRGHRAVQEVRRGIRRTLGTAQKGKEPLMTEQLRAALPVLRPGLVGIRDRALLLVGFGGAFRRSELVALDVDDVVFRTEGLLVTLRRSKTDQEGAGRTVALPNGSTPETCPSRALRAWLDAAGVTSGPLFRSVSRWGRAGGRLAGGDVARLVKRTAQAAGLDARELAGHSLRSGFATSAARAGASERQIMRQTGHKSIAMVRKYIHEGDAFTDNAGAGLL